MVPMVVPKRPMRFGAFLVFIKIQLIIKSTRMLIESYWHKQDSISVRALLISLCFNVMTSLIWLNVRLANERQF